MRRMLWAALLAGPVALTTAEPVQAQGYAGCGWGGGAAGPFSSQRIGFSVPPFPNPYGFAFRLYPGLHQHGPLVNYGPYSGYYPFEPYGPWTSDLRYAGPVGPQTVGDTGLAPRIRRPLAKGRSYAMTTLENVKSRLHPFHRFGCGTGCGK